VLNSASNELPNLEEKINSVLESRLTDLNQAIGELQQEIKELRGKLIAR
jgi:peptidoglycan hydrolase CwlO-like protein